MKRRRTIDRPFLVAAAFVALLIVVDVGGCGRDAAASGDSGSSNPAAAWSLHVTLSSSMREVAPFDKLIQDSTAVRRLSI